MQDCGLHNFHSLCGLQAVQGRGEVWVSLCLSALCKQGRIAPTNCQGVTLPARLSTAGNFVPEREPAGRYNDLSDLGDGFAQEVIRSIYSICQVSLCP